MRLTEGKSMQIALLKPCTYKYISFQEIYPQVYPTDHSGIRPRSMPQKRALSIYYRLGRGKDLYLWQL